MTPRPTLQLSRPGTLLRMETPRYVGIELTKEIQVSFGPHQFSLLVLINDWSARVLKFQADLDVNWDDPGPGIWGGDDLVGAYFLRDAIESGLDSLEEVGEGRNVAPLIAVDDLFRTFTEDDGDEKLLVLDRTLTVGSGWWWHRLPVRGPIVQQLTQYFRSAD